MPILLSVNNKLSCKYEASSPFSRGHLAKMGTKRVSVYSKFGRSEVCAWKSLLCKLSKNVVCSVVPKKRDIQEASNGGQNFLKIAMYNGKAMETSSVGNYGWREPGMSILKFQRIHFSCHR